MNIFRTTRYFPARAAVRRAGLTLAAFAAAASFAGCGDPPVDSNTAAPTGVLRGTVQYLGRRVDCSYENGAPVAVKGVLMLSLVDDRNPMPPEGTATMPVDLLALGGEDIFTNLATDCLPAAGEPNPLDPVIIQRSAPFEWTRIPLGPAMPEGANAADFEARYRVVGTYDQAGDFNPLFDVLQSPNSGDVAGAALENPLGGTSLLVVHFDSRTLAPLGQVRSGLNVTLGAVVATDTSLMYITEGLLSSETGWTGVMTDPALYPGLGLRLYGRTAATGDRAELDKTLTELKLTSIVDFANPLKYAFYVEPLDVDGNGIPGECAIGAGGPDCHPMLGAFLGTPWATPVVFLQRAQNEIEIAAGVPAVTFVPASHTEPAPARVQYPDLTMRIVPLATVMTNPAVDACRMLYFPSASSPGAGAFGVDYIVGSLPPGTALECSELPTGYYGASLLSGFAIQSPAQIAAEPDPTISQTGMVINGGEFAQQVWSLPNSLGNWVQVGDRPVAGAPTIPPPVCLPPGVAQAADPRCLPEQSLSGAFVVADPTPEGSVGRNDPSGAGGTCAGFGASLATNRWADDPARTDDFADLCCAPIRHLCNVPLCPFVEGGVTQTWSNDPAEMGMNVRSQPTSTTGKVTVNIGGQMVDRSIPNCVAFPMPSQCCNP